MMKRYAGITGEKNQSWICCNKESKSHVNFMTALDNFANGKTFREYDIQEIIKDKLYIFMTEIQYDSETFYNIAFTINDDNTIRPLFLTPYPCKINNRCDNITNTLKNIINT